MNNTNTEHENKMTPYFIRVKGSYKRFSDTPAKRINETYLIKLGSNMDNIDAQSIVSNYVGRVTGFTQMDIYEVEVTDKEFTMPNNYFHINNESQELALGQATPKEMPENIVIGLKEYIKNIKKIIADDHKLRELKGE